MRSISAFMEKWDVEYKGSFPIRDISYVHIGGIADVLAYPDTEEKLIALVDFLNERGVKYKIIGKMSNLLPPDEDYHGVLISTDRLSAYSQDGLTVYSAAGVPLTLLIARVGRCGLGGIEELFGIPASIGGAVYQNAGAFGKEIKDVIVSARVYDVNRHKILTLANEEMQFSYRKSLLREGGLIMLSVELRFCERAYCEIMRDIKAVTEKRRLSQPTKERSLGSTFMATGGVPAARLIDGAGLKGMRVGGAEVSQKHAGFIVNVGGATARDYLSLAELVTARIYQKYGVRLKMEIEPFF